MTFTGEALTPPRAHLLGNGFELLKFLVEDSCFMHELDFEELNLRPIKVATGSLGLRYRISEVPTVVCEGERRLLPSEAQFVSSGS